MIFFIILINFFVFAKGSIFEEAVKNYVRGNFSYSYKLLKEYIETDPADKKAIEMYVKVCIRLTEDNLNKGNDKEAYFYASEAYKYKPDDTKVENLYLVTRKMLKEKPPEKDVSVESVNLKERKFKKIEMPQMKTYRVSKTQEKRKESRKRTISKKPQQKIKIVTKVEKVKEIKRYIPDWIYISIFFNILLLFGVILYLRLKNPPKPDERFYSNVVTSKLLLANLLKRKSEFIKRRIPSSRLKDLLELLNVPEKMPSIKIKWRDKNDYLPDFDPVPRLISERLEVLEKFIDKGNEIVPVLKRYMSHPHNRVRATACKVMAKFKPQEAFKTLKEMADSEDRWMKISAIWALGEIGGKDSEKLLIKLKNDTDFMVSEKAEEVLRRIEQGKS